VFAHFLPHLFGDITNLSLLPLLPAPTAEERDAGGCDQTMRLLRAGRNRHHHRAAEQGDETRGVSFNHLVGGREQRRGISRPSALAVFRLMTRSNLVGCSTGSSAGFCTLEDASGISANLAIAVGQVASVAHWPPAWTNSRHS